jgi:hypothetical protein
VQSVNTEVSKASGAFTKGITDLKQYALGFVGVIAVAQGLQRVISSSVKLTLDFEKAQSNLQAILRTSKEDMKALVDQAKDLGRATVFTASQVLDAQTELAKLGFTMKQVTASTPAVLALAAATGTDLANAAKIAAETLNQFGLDANETARVVDVIAGATSMSAFTVDSFSGAMRGAGVNAKAAGADIETTAAALSLLVDAGIPAEKAGTDLRNIFIELSAKGLTWDEAMQQVRDSTDKVKTATELFGRRSGAAGIVISENEDKLNRLTAAYKSNQGIAQEMADVQLENVRGAITRLNSAWEGLIIDIEEGSGIAGKSISFLVDAATGFIELLSGSDTDRSVKKFTSLVQKEFEAIGGSGKLVAKAGDDVVDAMRRAADSARAMQGRTQMDIDLLMISRAKAAAEMDKANFEGNKVREAAARATIKIIDEEIKARKDVAGVAIADAKAEAAAVGTIKAKREELTATLERLKAERDDLHESDEQGIEDLDKQIAATQEAIRAIDNKTKATGRSSESTKVERTQVQGLTAAMRELAQQYNDVANGIMRVQSVRMPDVAAPLTPAGERTPLGPGLTIDQLPGTAIADNLDENLERTATLTTDYTNLFMNMSQGIGQSLADSFAGVEDANKKILLSILETVRSAIRLYLAGTLGKELFTKGLAGIATFAAISVAVEAAFAAAAAGVSGFASGGVVRQSDGPRYTKNKGDSVLISAAPGEVVMTEEQQRRANRAAGFNIFSAARVPGFAAGGQVTRGTALVNMPTTPRPTPAELSATRNAMSIANTPIYTRITEVNAVQGKVARIEERGTL